MYSPNREKEGRGYCENSDPWIYPEMLTNFITEQERTYILSKATGKFEDSQIVSGFDETIRKSKTAWLDKNDPIIHNIVERACRFVNLSTENAEDLQVVRYEPNGYYNEHHDASCDDYEDDNDRILTVLIYLNDGFEGGSTRFPNLDQEFKPPKNGALKFFPLQMGGSKCHPLALHAGMPVLSGEKFIANVWVREKEI